MDIRLMDLLHDLQGRLDNRDETIEIISGYRSPKTNMHLARLSGGVARNSYHLRGMAIDLRMPERLYRQFTIRRWHGARWCRLLSRLAVRACRCRSHPHLVNDEPGKGVIRIQGSFPDLQVKDHGGYQSRMLPLCPFCAKFFKHTQPIFLAVF